MTEPHVVGVCRLGPYGRMAVAQAAEEFAVEGGGMLFFFDESGDFAPADDDAHKCGVICGVAVPETTAPAAESEYQQFAASLSNAEKEQGEPKGSLLSDASRIRFCQMLKSWGDVYITPTTLLLSRSLLPYHDDLPDHMREKFYGEAERAVHDTMREHIQLLARQWANLSVQQGLRLVALAKCFQEAVHHAVIFLSGREYDACWQSMHFHVDATRNRPYGRDARVFELMVLMWLTAWSRRDPTILIKEIHSADHPFVRAYETEKGIDLGKLLRHNIRFVSSRDTWGIQVADICANIVYRAVHDPDNHNDRVRFFRLLVRSSPYGPIRGPGLICLKPGRTGAGKRPAPRYRLLYEVMKHD